MIAAGGWVQWLLMGADKKGRRAILSHEEALISKVEQQTYVEIAT